MLYRRRALEKIVVWILTKKNALFGLSWKLCWLCKNCWQFLFEDPSTDKKLPNETLMEVKPTLTEKGEIEKNVEIKILPAFLCYQDSETEIKIHHFAIEESVSSKKVLCEFLMVEFKLVVVEKWEFENVMVNIDVLRIFSRPRIGSKKNAPRAQYWTRVQRFSINKKMWNLGASHIWNKSKLSKCIRNGSITFPEETYQKNSDC